MKKYLLIITAFALILNAKSQTFTVETTEQSAEGKSTDFDIYELVSFDNITMNDITVSWELVSDDMPSGWEVSICDPCQCSPIGITSKTGCVVSPNKLNAYVNSHFYPNGVAGTGQSKVRIWDETSLDEITITFNATASEPLSLVDNVETSYVAVSPNPSSSVFSVDYSFQGKTNLSMEVYDLLGKRILKKENLTAKGKFTIDEIQDQGIYICVFKSNDTVLEHIKIKKI